MKKTPSKERYTTKRNIPPRASDLISECPMQAVPVKIIAKSISPGEESGEWVTENKIDLDKIDWNLPT